MHKANIDLDQSLVVTQYRGEPFRCWQKGKELRLKIYRDYAAAHERGGLRVSGTSWGFLSVPMGLGDDVYYLTSEPYSASTAYDRTFSIKCLEAAESKGWAPDLCGYARNYWGTIMLNQYPFGGPFPKPDLLWHSHICCTHAKWYQVVSELEGGTPYYCVDVGAGSHRPGCETPLQHRIDYVAAQLHEGIEWMERNTGRRYDDEKLIAAVHNDCNASALWAEICCLNKAVPAPMDEKSMFAWFNLAGIGRHLKEATEFYTELLDELKDRIARGVAAVPSERCRIFGDSPPPWGFLHIYRYLEQYGCVSVGSFYTFGIFGMWQEDERGERIARQSPQQRGLTIRSRDEALRILAEWYLGKPHWQAMSSVENKSDVLIKIAKQWHCDGAILHYNRGCEMGTLGAAENRLALLEAGVPVVTYEGNMGDEREFDEGRVRDRIDAFMERMGLRKLV